MPPAPPTSPAPVPGRRQVLRVAAGLGLGLVLTGTVTGCGIRLEDGAPNLPFVPTRTPLPAEAALLELLAQTRELVTLTRAWSAGAGLATQLSAIHDDQADVLAALLRGHGVPDSVLAGTPPPSASPGASTPRSTAASTGPAGGPTTPGPTSGTPSASGVAPTKAMVAAQEAAALTHASTLGGANDALRPTLVALLAQRAAAVSVLTGKAPRLDRPATPTWASGAATALLAATRSARYGFEVVAAQGDPATSRAATSALAVLAGLDREQTAAVGGPGPDPAGYVLPFPVHTPAAAARLGDGLAKGLLAAYGTVLTSTNPANTPSTVPDLVDWLARAQVLAHRWHAPLAAFPGLVQQS